MKKKYKYEVSLSRYGGEHTIGTIPKKVADYWLEKGEDEFQDYIFSIDWDDDKEELNKTIPEEFQIEEYWHDMDDVDHINGAEYHSQNYLYVNDVSGNIHSVGYGVEVGEFPLEDIPIQTVHDQIADAINEDGDNPYDEEVIVYGQSFEKGSWEYETIETDEPFDISKLKVDISMWNGLKLVSDINYDGECYCNNGGNTMGKSMAFWIDD